MTKNTRKFITTLRQQFKAADGTTKKQIWSILTALRGPDTHDDGMEKTSTTAVIRHAVFGVNLEHAVPAQVDTDSNESRDFRTDDGFVSYHFENHAQEAFEALNLKWDEINLPKTKKKK